MREDWPILNKIASIKLYSFDDALFLDYLRTMPSYALPTSCQLDPYIGSSILPASILAFGLLFGSEAESDYRYVSIYTDFKVVRHYRRDYALVRLHIR